jgi:predicted transcriptional regulator
MKKIRRPAMARSKKGPQQKSKVKFYLNSVRTRVIPILKRIEDGDYPTKIGRMFGWSKQHVFYYIRNLQKAGLIRRDKRSSAVFYELTIMGKKLLKGCEGPIYSSGVYRLHKCQVRYPILAEGVLPKDFKRIEMMNWTALLGLEHEVKVRHTTRSWIVHVKTLYGRSPTELGALAKGLADRVADSLHRKYGCRLGEGRLCKGYEIALDDSVAQFFSQYFTISTPKRKIDRSLGKLKGEIDHLSRDTVLEYLMMPERIKSIEEHVKVLGQRLEEVTALLTSIFGS